MITGDEEMATATLVGSQRGYHYRKVVDRFIHNVTKTEETAEHHWADHRLTTACREGYTLIYDEFTRSSRRPTTCSSACSRRDYWSSRRRIRTSPTSRCIRISASSLLAIRRNMPASTRPRMRLAIAS